MRRIGSLLIVLCIPGTLLLGWVGFPLSPALAGISFRLLEHSQAGMSPVLTSYGAIAGLILICAAGAYQTAAFRQLYWAAAALLLLVAAAPLQIAFHDPALLRWLASEADWQQRAKDFALIYEPANFGSEATVWSLVPLDTISDRLIAGWYFMGTGWYLTVLAACVLTFAALRGVTATARLRLVSATVALLLVTFVLLARAPYAAERALVKGMRAEGRGASEEAINYYREGMRLDGWWALNTDLRKRIGVIDAALGRNTTPDYRIYRAELMLRQGHPREAIAEYEHLGVSSEFAPLARARAADIWTDFGLQLYAIGSFGSAVHAWQSALKQQPSDWLAAFCLTRAYFAVARNQEAAKLASTFSNTSDPVFRADLDCNAGDALTRDGAIARAHSIYWLSYQSDHVYNRRALASLVGP